MSPELVASLGQQWWQATVLLQTKTTNNSGRTHFQVSKGRSSFVGLTHLIGSESRSGPSARQAVERARRGSASGGQALRTERFLERFSRMVAGRRLRKSNVAWHLIKSRLLWAELSWESHWASKLSVGLRPRITS